MLIFFPRASGADGHACCSASSLALIAWCSGAPRSCGGRAPAGGVAPRSPAGSWRLQLYDRGRERRARARARALRSAQTMNGPCTDLDSPVGRQHARETPTEAPRVRRLRLPPSIPQTVVAYVSAAVAAFGILRRFPDLTGQNGAHAAGFDACWQVMRYLRRGPLASSRHCISRASRPGARASRPCASCPMELRRQAPANH